MVLILNKQSIRIDRISSQSQWCEFLLQIEVKLYIIVPNELNVTHDLHLAYSIGIINYALGDRWVDELRRSYEIFALLAGYCIYIMPDEEDNCMVVDA